MSIPKWMMMPQLFFPILTMEGVIHASWNWPFNRKDMHVYGTTGYAFIDDAETIRYRLDEKSKEKVEKVPLSEAPFSDPFKFFASAIKGEIIIQANGSGFSGN